MGQQPAVLHPRAGADPLLEHAGRPRTADPACSTSGLGVAQSRASTSATCPRLRPNEDAVRGSVPDASGPTLDEASQTPSGWWPTPSAPRSTSLATHGATGASYHYDGDGGITLSSSTRRAVFALALGQQGAACSRTRSRRLPPAPAPRRPRPPRDPCPVHPLGRRGRAADRERPVVFVVDGYTTSDSYPYAEQVVLGRHEGQLRPRLGRWPRSTRSPGR